MANKTITLLLSVMVGLLGIERMYLGCYGTGLLKMLTLGGFGLLYVMDIYTLLSSSLAETKTSQLLGCSRVSWDPSTIKTSYYAAIILLIFMVLHVIVGAPMVANITDNINSQMMQSEQNHH